MTKHVRKNYRNHRKATWGFAIALMVAIAVSSSRLQAALPTRPTRCCFPRQAPSRRAAGEREHD